MVNPDDVVAERFQRRQIMRNDENGAVLSKLPDEVVAFAGE